MTGLWRIRGLFHRPVCVCLGAALLLGLAAAVPGPVGAAVGSYAEELVEEARRRRLHDERYWHILLHYQRSLTGVTSRVDDPKFFLAPDGKRNPEAELAATIRAFFEPEVEGGKHPVCRFVARYAWVREQLGLDPSRLAVGECAHFVRLLADMRPEGTTLVFPTAHMNSPASMFGHTLLLFETAAQSRLLAYAVNYSAITQETFGPLFAVRGIFGAYPGYFSVLPYYAKLQEYADIDHRDLWEYPLDFTREETIRAIRHVYELDGIASDYFFFDENCAYALLFLLEAGRPSLRLTDRTLPWVIPLDTIRLVQEAGLVTGTLFRPSKTTTIRRLAAGLDRAGRLLAREAAEGRVAPAQILKGPGSAAERGRTLDLAVEYLQYRYSRRELERPAYADRLVGLLTARSGLGPLEGNGPAPPAPPQPEAGHRSRRLSLGGGVEGGQAFQELRFRFAYHTLADDDRGYLEGSHIVFGDTALRYLFEEERLRLERLDLIEIVSLAPRDELFQPISWKITAGAAQRVMEDGRKHLVGRLVPGGGLAYRIPLLGLGYALLETEANLGEALREHYALGAGGSVGILRNITERWKLLLTARGMAYGLGDRHSLLEATMTHNLRLTPNAALSLEVTRGKTREFYRTEALLALNLFF